MVLRVMTGDGSHASEASSSYGSVEWRQATAQEQRSTGVSV